MTLLINRRDKKRYDFYIGRGTTFGNPHTIGYCNLCNKTHDRKDCVDTYKIYFYNRLLTDSSFHDKVLSLKGQTLGCWCKPKLCHGDIIIEYLEGIPNENERTNNVKTTHFFD